MPDSQMHVIQFLQDPECVRSPADTMQVEYRLLCSGTLYRTVIGDWSKSEASRFLLAPPLMLFAASRPIYDYPLELLLSFRVAQVNITTPGMGGTTLTTTFHPDAEVARDLASLLTVLCRRLITVSGKTKEEHAHYPYNEFGHMPFPVTAMSRVYWPSLSATVITSHTGQEIRNNNPPPLSVDPGVFTNMLIGLPDASYAESIVASARLYALALELIREQPELSYQLLISAVETIANEALSALQPDDDEKVEFKRPVYKLARELGMDDAIARKMAIEACKGENWATRKFKAFITDNLDESIWDKEDDLFKPLPNWALQRRDLQKTLGKIYSARSKATHLGEPFPLSASYAGGPNLSVGVFASLFGNEVAFPPIAWFERVVNSAIRGFWWKSVAAR